MGTSGTFICVAAGILISSPLIIAFPQAISKNENAGFAALAGFVFMFLIVSSFIK